MFDESMSTFFRNVDTRFSGGGRDIPLDGGRNPIKMLRARSVLIDTESGVLKQVVNGPLGELFDHHQFVTDVESSGAGNNWCVAVAVVCVPVLLHCSPVNAMWRAVLSTGHTAMRCMARNTRMPS